MRPHAPRPRCLRRGIIVAWPAHGSARRWTPVCWPMHAACVRDSRTRRSSTKRYKPFLLGNALRRWTPATPPMTSIRSTNRTRGATSRRSAKLRRALERDAGSRRAVVVRPAGGRPAPRRRAVPRCRNPAPSTHAGRAVHVDDPVAPQRGRRPGTGRGSCPSAVRGQPRLRRERLGRRPRRATRTARRRQDAGDLQRVGDRRRLPGLRRTCRPRSRGPCARGSAAMHSRRRRRRLAARRRRPRADAHAEGAHRVLGRHDPAQRPDPRQFGVVALERVHVGRHPRRTGRDVRV